MGFRSLVFFRWPVSATGTDFVVGSRNSLYFLKAAKNQGPVAQKLVLKLSLK